MSKARHEKLQLDLHEFHECFDAFMKLSQQVDRTLNCDRKDGNILLNQTRLFCVRKRRNTICCSDVAATNGIETYLPSTTPLSFCFKNVRRTQKARRMELRMKITRNRDLRESKREHKKQVWLSTPHDEKANTTEKQQIK